VCLCVLTYLGRVLVECFANSFSSLKQCVLRMVVFVVGLLQRLYYYPKNKLHNC